MINFPYTRTRRVAVRLTELTLGEAIGICKLPSDRHEVTATSLLRCIAKGAEKPVADRYVTDPRLWTVEERTLLIATYLAHVTPDGPDFSIGSGNLSNYVDFAKDSTIEQTDLGSVNESDYVMRPLLGIHAETLETLCKSRGDWMIGVVACQLFDKTKSVPDWGSLSDVQMLDYVQERIDAMRALPESAFEALWLAHGRGALLLQHFFVLNFDDTGIVYEPLAQDEEGAGYAPARFLALSCIGGIAKALAGRAD